MRIHDKHRDTYSKPQLKLSLAQHVYGNINTPPAAGMLDILVLPFLATSVGDGLNFVTSTVLGDWVEIV